MTEQEQFLNTVREVLKPFESSGISRAISAREMHEKLQIRLDNSERKFKQADELYKGYIISRNPDNEELEYIKEQIEGIFNDYKNSFTR